MEITNRMGRNYQERLLDEALRHWRRSLWDLEPPPDGKQKLRRVAVRRDVHQASKGRLTWLTAGVAWSQLVELPWVMAQNQSWQAIGRLQN